MEKLKICSLCKYWQREKIYNWPDKDKDASIGQCSELNNDLQYWDNEVEAQNKIENGKIGCENLYTHENFGCIHHLMNK
jgi:hypothetical protein